MGLFICPKTIKNRSGAGTVKRRTTMLKLNASFSKKVPAEQEYSSKGYSATIEVELPDGLTQQQLEARISDTFELVRDSVEKEITGNPVNVPMAPVVAMPVAQVPVAATPVVQQPATTQNVAASPKQIKYLLDLARQGNIQLADYFQQLGINDPSQLSRKNCSNLIDQLSGKKAA
jgi:hypothetical protein